MMPSLLLYECNLVNISILICNAVKRNTQTRKNANPDKTVPDEFVLSGLAVFISRCHAICFNFVYGNRIKQNKTVTNPEKMTLFINRLVGTGKVYT